MKCNNCQNETFDYNDIQECICIHCGCVQEQHNDTEIEFQNKQYNRCETYENKTQTLLLEYLKCLKNTWPHHHIINIQHAIQTILETITEKNTVGPIIVATVLKYASQNNIACNIKEHQKKMKLSTKNLGQTMKRLDVGLISEGLCNKSVRKFVDTYGDTGIVRPTSLEGTKIHSSTRSVADITKNSTIKRTYHTSHEFPFLNSLIVTYFNNALPQNNIQSKIILVYSELSKTTLYTKEGEIMTSLVSLFIVLRHCGIIKKYHELCLKTRLTSVPTFTKIMKKYNPEKFVFNILNIG